MADDLRSQRDELESYMRCIKVLGIPQALTIIQLNLIRYVCSYFFHYSPCTTSPCDRDPATAESTLSIIKLGPLPSFAPFPVASPIKLSPMPSFAPFPVVSPIKLSPMPSFTPFPVGSPSFLPRGGADACTATGNVQCCESTQSVSLLSINPRERR